MSLSAFDWRAQPSETAHAFHGGKRPTYSTSRAPNQTFAMATTAPSHVHRPAEAPRKKASKFDVHAMYLYRKDGHSWAEVGKQFGCTLSNARRLVQNEYEDGGGYCMAKRLPADEIEAMRAMRADGAIYADIARKFGLSTSAVSWRLTRSTAMREESHAV